MGLGDFFSNIGRKVSSFWSEKVNPTVQNVVGGFKKGFNTVVDFGAPIVGAIPGVGAIAMPLIRSGQKIANTVADAVGAGSQLLATGDFKGVVDTAKEAYGNVKTDAGIIKDTAKEAYGQIRQRGANVQKG